MNSNNQKQGKTKIGKTTWTIYAVCFAVAIIGMFTLSSNLKAGEIFLFSGLGGLMLTCVWMVVKSILATSNPRATGLKFIGILHGEAVVIGIGLVLDLGSIGTGILAVVVFIVALMVKTGIDNTACPKCGKKLSMKEISKTTTSSCATTMDIRREVKNIKGEVIRTYFEAVPATRYFYDCIDECKFCGYQRAVKRDATYRD